MIFVMSLAGLISMINDMGNAEDVKLAPPKCRDVVIFAVICANVLCIGMHTYLNIEYYMQIYNIYITTTIYTLQNNINGYTHFDFLSWTPSAVQNYEL